MMPRFTRLLSGTAVSATESLSRRANLLLAIGATVGIALAASGMLEPREPDLAANTIARVGDDRIDKQEYLAYLDLLAQDKRNPLTTEDQRHVLDRMIDEKLLLARGLEIGLPQSSPQVRKTIVQQVMQSILAEVSSEQSSEDQLRDFYQDNMAYFARPPRTQVRRLVFRDRDGETGRQLADKAWQALQHGESFEAVGRDYATEDMLPIPGEPLPDHKLLQYLGPSLTAATREMDSGDFSTPIDMGNNVIILQVPYKQAMQPRPFEEVRDRVATEYERRRGDEALAAYLEDLRRQAEIAVDETFLDSIAPGPG